MAVFTEEQQAQIKLLLGYASVPNILTAELTEDRNQVYVDRALTLLTELGAIDEKLSAATSDSMAKAVGNLQLSYSQHVAHLKSEGTRLLKELSQLLGISIVYNKYRSGSASVARYW